MTKHTLRLAILAAPLAAAAGFAVAQTAGDAPDGGPVAEAARPIPAQFRDGRDGGATATGRAAPSAPADRAG